jgi:hypothetical protein
MATDGGLLMHPSKTTMVLEEVFMHCRSRDDPDSVERSVQTVSAPSWTVGLKTKDVGIRISRVLATLGAFGAQTHSRPSRQPRVDFGTTSPSYRHITNITTS